MMLPYNEFIDIKNINTDLEILYKFIKESRCTDNNIIILESLCIDNNLITEGIFSKKKKEVKPDSSHSEAMDKFQKARDKEENDKNNKPKVVGSNNKDNSTKSNKGETNRENDNKKESLFSRLKRKLLNFINSTKDKIVDLQIKRSKAKGLNKLKIELEILNNRMKLKKLTYAKAIKGDDKELANKIKSELPKLSNEIRNLSKKINNYNN